MCRVRWRPSAITPRLYHYQLISGNLRCSRVETGKGTADWFGELKSVLVSILLSVDPHACLFCGPFSESSSILETRWIYRIGSSEANSSWAAVLQAFSLPRLFATISNLWLLRSTPEYRPPARRLKTACVRTNCSISLARLIDRKAC